MKKTLALHDRMARQASEVDGSRRQAGQWGMLGEPLHLIRKSDAEAAEAAAQRVSTTAAAAFGREVSMKILHFDFLSCRGRQRQAGKALRSTMASIRPAWIPGLSPPGMVELVLCVTHELVNGL